MKFKWILENELLFRGLLASCAIKFNGGIDSFFAYFLHYICQICLNHAKFGAYILLLMDMAVYEACLFNWLWG
jgi:hypothetical protein